MKNLLNSIEQHELFARGEKVGVAVSGGLDSVSLLHILFTNKNRFGIDVVCFNLDHKIRGEESAKESEFVEQFCKKLGVSYFHKDIDVVSFAKNNKQTIEQAARILRYEALFEMAKEQKVDKIAVAHHKEDQAETILLHVFRGSGLKGATGMEFVSNNKIVRPLLDVTKKDIEKYAFAYKLTYVNDSSNFDDKFSRNYIRHRIMPDIKEKFPAVVENLAAFADNCRSDEDFISSVLPKNCLIIKNDEVKIVEKVKSLHFALSSRIVRNAFLSLDALVDIEQTHVELVLALFDLPAGRRLNMPNNIEVHREYDGIVLSKKVSRKAANPKPFAEGKFIFEDWGEILVEKFVGTPLYGAGVQYLDADKLSSKCLFRTRSEGDMFAKLGSGTKKLANYYTDKKIPLRLRDDIPIIASGENVLVVIGYDIGEAVKTDKGTKKIYRIKYKKY